MLKRWLTIGNSNKKKKEKEKYNGNTFQNNTYYEYDEDMVTNGGSVPPDNTFVTAGNQSKATITATATGNYKQQFSASLDSISMFSENLKNFSFKEQEARQLDAFNSVTLDEKSPKKDSQKHNTTTDTNPLYNGINRPDLKTSLSTSSLAKIPSITNTPDHGTITNGFNPVSNHGYTNGVNGNVKSNQNPFPNNSYVTNPNTNNLNTFVSNNPFPTSFNTNNNISSDKNLINGNTNTNNNFPPNNTLLNNNMLHNQFQNNNLNIDKQISASSSPIQNNAQQNNAQHFFNPSNNNNNNILNGNGKINPAMNNQFPPQRAKSTSPLPQLSSNNPFSPLNPFSHISGQGTTKSFSTASSVVDHDHNMTTSTVIHRNVSIVTNTSTPTMHTVPAATPTLSTTPQNDFLLPQNEIEEECPIIITNKNNLIPYGDGSNKIFGFENFGNTCYCNSVLQCLFNITAFRIDLLQYPPKPNDLKRMRKLDMRGNTPRIFTESNVDNKHTLSSSKGTSASKTHNNNSTPASVASASKTHYSTSSTSNSHSSSTPTRGRTITGSSTATGSKNHSSTQTTTSKQHTTTHATSSKTNGSTSVTRSHTVAHHSSNTKEQPLSTKPTTSTTTPSSRGNNASSNPSTPGRRVGSVSTTGSGNNNGHARSSTRANQSSTSTTDKAKTSENDPNKATNKTPTVAKSRSSSSSRAQHPGVPTKPSTSTPKTSVTSPKSNVVSPKTSHSSSNGTSKESGKDNKASSSEREKDSKPATSNKGRETNSAGNRNSISKTTSPRDTKTPERSATSRVSRPDVGKSSSATKPTSNVTRSATSNVRTVRSTSALSQKDPKQSSKGSNSGTTSANKDDKTATYSRHVSTSSTSNNKNSRPTSAKDDKTTNGKPNVPSTTPSSSRPTNSNKDSKTSTEKNVTAPKIPTSRPSSRSASTSTVAHKHESSGISGNRKTSTSSTNIRKPSSSSSASKDNDVHRSTKRDSTSKASNENEGDSSTAKKESHSEKTDAKSPSANRQHARSSSNSKDNKLTSAPTLTKPNGVNSTNASSRRNSSTATASTNSTDNKSSHGNSNNDTSTSVEKNNADKIDEIVKKESRTSSKDIPIILTADSITTEHVRDNGHVIVGRSNPKKTDTSEKEHLLSHLHIHSSEKEDSTKISDTSDKDDESESWDKEERLPSEQRKKLALVKGPIVNVDHLLNDSGKATLYNGLKDIFECIVENKCMTGVVSPSEFVSILKKENLLFNSKMHQDAHEFLNFLLNSLSEYVIEYMKSDPNAFPSDYISELFKGTLLNKTRCLTCDCVTSREEPFLDFQIEVLEDKTTNIQDELQNYQQREMLNASNKFYCDTCGGLQEAERIQKLKQLPKTLALHLKRFKYSEEKKSNIKLFNKVDYPLVLNVSSGFEEGVSKRYELSGIVVHMGAGPQHGHYVAICKHERFGWLLMDDETVETISEETVLNCKGDKNDLTTAYVLFYRECEDYETIENDYDDNVRQLVEADTLVREVGDLRKFDEFKDHSFSLSSHIPHSTTEVQERVLNTSRNRDNNSSSSSGKRKSRLFFYKKSK